MNSLDDNPTRPLFRHTAIAAHKSRRHGDILLATPIPLGILATLASCAAAAVIAFSIFGQYTEHVTLPGQLMPNNGTIDVYSPQAGRITRKSVVEGQRVARGDELYIVSSEHPNDSVTRLYAAVAQQMEARRRSLLTQISATRRLAQSKLSSIAAERGARLRERDRIKHLIRNQAKRVALAQNTAHRYVQLGSQGFVAQEQVAAKRSIALDLRARLEDLKRSNDDLGREIANLAHQAKSEPVQLRVQIARLESDLATLAEAQLRNEAAEAVTITAPLAGIATAPAAHQGQTIRPGDRLVTIVPEDASLEADLIASSRSVGFIGVGDAVLLRYAAYPYQKFGHFPGTITSVSKTAFAAAELAPAKATAGSTPASPLYRVTVQLDAQSVSAYGTPHRLRAGMAVAADVPLDRRRIYEWMLAPLHAIRGWGDGQPKSGEPH